MEERQYHIQCKKGEVGRYVLLPGDPFRTDAIAAHLTDARIVAHNREHKTWTGLLDGVRVSVTSTGMGSPSTAIALEELIRIGADTFIRVGTAGFIGEGVQEPGLCGAICTAAIRDEGTSTAYVPLAYPAVADRRITGALCRAAEELGLFYLEGITRSTDSLYAEMEPETVPLELEQRRRLKTLARAGAIASEMEAAALFVIASIRGCRAGAIVSFDAMDSTIKVAVNALRLVIKSDKERTATWDMG